MTVLAYVVFGLAVLLSFNQCLVVAFFLRVMRSYRGAPPADQSLPKAAVILSLRGPDPDLDIALEGLLQQDYANYSVHLIVDSQTDPVWQDIERVLDNLNVESVQVSVLQQPRGTCSLKCSSLIEAVEALDADCEVVAFMDGDAPPHRTWLASLVQTLRDERVGVAYGNRWFIPKSADWGSLVRYFWNVGAVVQVWLNQLVWAGSMAMRRETIDQVDLLAAWSRALSVDATVHRQMRKHGYKIRFVPGVLMVNRETISLSQFVQWVQRQLIAAKSSGPSWRLVAAHALNLVSTQVVAVVVLVWALAVGNALAVKLAAVAMAIYWSSSLLCVFVVESSVQRNLHINNRDIKWIRGAVLRRYLPAIVLTHFAYAYAICGALFRKQVSWRGIDYQILRNGNIEMLKYHPYADDAKVRPSESVV